MMTRTIKILTLLAVMAITAGQAWAEAPTYGKIHYTQGGTDGGRLSFSTTLEKTYNAQTDFKGSGVESGNDWIYTYTVTDRTLTDSKVYVRAVPSFGYTVTDMTLIVEPSAPSSTAEAPRRGAPTVGSTIPVTPVEGHSGVYTFPMPTDGTNVTVTASFPVSTPIDVDYLDATGAKKTAQAYVLDGAELSLGKDNTETWYVCNSAIDYRTQLRLYGDTHIILADGCEMSVTNTGTIAINAGNSVLIYGQSQGTGKLSVEVTPSDNHYAPSGIYASNTITINGGIIDVKAHAATATATGQMSFAIYAGAEVFINGGQVTATGGDGIKSSEGDIILNWTNATDFIKASCYFIEGTGNVKTADGKPFIAYTPAATANDSEKQAVLIQGNTTLDANAITAIAGKVLRPATTDDVTVKYLDAKGDEQNTAEDNITDNDIVYVLQGNPNGDETLAGGWYVAEGEVSYTGQLQFTGNAHLILADDAEMSFGTANNPIYVTAINTDDYTLSIYGQSTGDDMGTLSIYTTQGVISASALTINGGHVIGNTNGDYVAAIFTGNANITINGGTIESTTSGTSAHAIEANGTFTYTGGTVTAIGTIYAKGDIILGWTNATDFINASSYTIDGTGSVKTADGKRFIAYNMASADDISANCIIGSATGETTLNDTDLDNIAGKTLRPLEGYYVKDQAGLTFSGKTNDDGSAKPDFTITTDAGTEDEKTTPYYIYKASTEQNPVSVVVSVTGHDDDHMSITTTPAVDQTDDEAFSHCFAMPAQDVTITGIKYYNYGVDYMDWDDTQKKLVSATTPENTKVWHLDGTGTTHGAGWYLAQGEVSYNSTLNFTGNTNLILADGAKLTVNTNDDVVINTSGTLTIYGQTDGSGKINATGSGFGKCFNAQRLTINGGQVIANGGEWAYTFYINNGVTINGGYVYTDSGGYGIYVYNGNITINDGFIYFGCAANGLKANNITINDGTVYVAGEIGFEVSNNLTINDGVVNVTGTVKGVYANNITINGGQVTAEGRHDGIKANTFILGWTSASDYIIMNQYDGTVKIPGGKSFAIDGTSTILGGETETTIADLTTINGKTLRPSKNFPVAAGQQYTALYQEQGDWKVTNPDVKMYVPTGKIIKVYDGTASEYVYEMELQEVTDGGIPDGVPVIAGVESGTLPANIPVVGTSKTEADNIENAYDKAEEAIEQKQGDTEPVLTLIATNTTETLAQQIIDAASPKDEQGNVIEETKVDPSDYIVFSLVNGKLTATSANQTTVPSSAQPVIVVNKFDFLQMIRGTYNVTASNAPTRGIPFDFGEDETMGINSLTPTLSEGEGVWYTIDGRKISGKPVQKGMYINQGKKVIIR